MRIVKNNLFFGLILGALALAIFAIATLDKSSQLAYSNFTMTGPNGVKANVQFPLYMASPANGTYELNGIITKESLSGTRVQIIPDDEVVAILINNRPVELSAIPESARRDYRNGFTYDLDDYLNDGENKIQIIFTDTGGMMGINFKSLYGDKLGNAVLLLSGLFVSLLIIKTNLNRSFKVLLLVALFIRLFYFSITPPDTRTHDQEEHLEYSEYLAKHWLPPALEKATDGAYFHPPLYYYTGAIAFKITRALGPISNQEAQRIQQLLCLAYSMGFVYFGLLLIRQFLNITHKTPVYAAPPQPTFAPLPVKRSKEYGKHLNSKCLQLLLPNKKFEP